MIIFYLINSMIKIRVLYYTIDIIDKLIENKMNDDYRSCYYNIVLLSFKK